MPAKKKGKAPAKGKAKADAVNPETEEVAAVASTAPPQEMIAVFDTIQAPHPPYKKAISMLNKYRRSIKGADAPDTFFNGFTGIVRHLLVIFKREKAVTRCVEFVVRYVAQPGKEFDNELLNRFTDYLLTFSSAKDKAVRLRVCQIIGKLLDTLPDDAEIDDDTFEAIEKAGMLRLTDKIPGVRVQAATLLTRLQDPEDVDDPITKLYLHTIENDSSPDVRRSVLAQIGPSKRSLPVVLAATRDSAAIVRKEAFKYVRDQIDVKALKVSQRLKLIKDGLNDRDSGVKAECVRMLCESWFGGKSADSLGAAEELLARLDVHSDEKVCAQAATEVIKFVRDWRITAEHFAGELSCERALMWRTCSEYFTKTKNYDAIEQLVLPVPDMGLVIKKAADKCSEATDFDTQLEAQFVTKQLLQLAQLLDYADEAGRRKMAEVVSEVLRLTNVPASIIDEAIALSKVLIPDETERVQTIVELISEIRAPIQKIKTTKTKQQEREQALQLSKVTVQLTELRITMEDLVQQQEFSKAGEIKEEITMLEATKKELQASSQDGGDDDEGASQQLLDDPETWAICLTIAQSLIKSTSLTMQNTWLNGLLGSTILPAVAKADPETRNEALTTLGLACLRNRTADLAVEHLPTLLLVLKLDQDIIKHTILKILFDLVLLFGADAFQVPDSMQEATADDDEEEVATGESAESTARNPAASVIQALQSYLNHADDELRAIAVEGFCKLFLLNHVTSPKIFSQLTLLYFSPLTADDARLRQCLRLFFPAFAFSSTNHAMVLEEAFMPTMRRITAAKKSSPLRAIKPAAVAKFFVVHTSQAEGAGCGTDEMLVHEPTAIKVLNEMLSCPNTAEMKALSPTLSMFNVASFSALGIKSLEMLVTSLLEEVSTQTERKKLDVFYQRLSAAGANTDLSEEQQAQIEEDAEKQRVSREAEIETLGTDDAEAKDPGVRRTASRRAAKSASKSMTDEHEEAEAPAEAPAEAETEANADEDEDVDEEEFEVERLLQRRPEDGLFLVKWIGYPNSDNTWEPKEALPPAMVAAWESDEAEEKVPTVAQENVVPHEASAPAQSPIKTAAAAPEADDDVDLLLGTEEAEPISASPKRSSSRGRGRKTPLADLNDSIDELLM